MKHVRDVPGFRDQRNAESVAAWRVRLAKNQGKDLADLRLDRELVIRCGVCSDNSMPRRDWSEYDAPAIKRFRRTIVSALLRPQAA